MIPQNNSLKKLFEEIRSEELPANFRANVMKRVFAEAEKMQRRRERQGLIAVIAASIIMLGIALSSFIYIGIPTIHLPKMPTPSLLFFYGYIGSIALLLLIIDYRIRLFFRKKQQAKNLR